MPGRSRAHNEHGGPTRRSARISKRAAVGVFRAPGAARSADITQAPSRSTAVASKCTSARAFPSIREAHFGMIQSLLFREPFWLLVAVTLLNKTPGKSARPIFWAVKQRWPDVPTMAAADQEELCRMIRSLGLQSQRSRRIQRLAAAWSTAPPQAAVRYRTKDYPRHGDGRDIDHRILSDATECRGALEIGHLPGCGPYAWDSWRIFCRDMLRGVADDYNGLHAAPNFEPEWKRVRPLDKELRGCLQWMWLREGRVWDPATGKSRAATELEMADAVRGEC